MITQVIVQGHRGARGHFPENTVAGFIKAVELGVDAVELDVVISGDGEVVVSHEAWMSDEFCSLPGGQPIAAGKGREHNMYQMSYAEIKKYDCGKRGHPGFPSQANIPSYKPLLKEVITAVEDQVKKNNHRPVSYNIELKTENDSGFNPPPRVFTELVLREIAKHRLDNRISYSSFDLEILRELKARDPSIAIGLLVENKNSFEKNIELLGFIPDTYNADFRLVSASLVKEAHEKGIRVMAWTVNEKKDMEFLIAQGVDGIISDYPDRLIGLLKKNNEEL